MSDTDYRHGQRLLRDLLPWARAEARKGDASFLPQNALGRATADYVTEANLDALLIYPAPLGGWRADVTFKHMPAGMPSAMGTPVGRPLRTRRDAEEQGKGLLVGLLAGDRKPKLAAQPVFLLCGHSVTLSAEAIAETATLLPEDSRGYASKGHAINRIEETITALCPKGFSKQAFEALDIMEKARLLAVLHTAAMTGVFVYPPRVDGAPSSTH